MPRKQYTAAQKAAYYKKKASIQGRGAYRRRGAKRVAYKGRGAYTKKGSSMPQLESYADKGRRIGGNLGAGIGELGNEIYKFFTGRGSYNVVNNSLLDNDPSMPPIYNKVNKPGSTVIRKSEYIGDIISSSSANTFSNTSYSVNPGVSTVFSWLSQIAVNYEEYEFIGMYFEYRSMSADALNSVNTALGQVILAMDYNASNSAFTSKQQMENYESAISAKPSQSIRFFVECSKQQNVLGELYVRGDLVPTGDDIRLYDMGNFQVATNGFQGTSVNCGELWVCYEVALGKSKLYSALGLDIAWFGGVITGYSAASPLNTVTPWTDYTLGITTTATSISFPLRNAVLNYWVYIEWIGTGAAALQFPAITPTNCTQRTQTTPVAADTAKAMCLCLMVTTTGVGVPSLALGTGGTFPTSVANGTIFITEISTGIPVTSF